MERMPSPQRWDEVLVELYELAGSPGVRVVEDYARRDPDAGSLSKSTVGELLNGKANPRRASVEAFVLGCLYYARTRRPPVVLPDGQDVSNHWMDRYDQTAGADTSRSRGVAEVRAQPAPLGTSSPGQPLQDITDPYALEVHPAIDVVRQTGAEVLPLLPMYVTRAHDARLRDLVDNAHLGISGVGVAVGSSSSGKSRSCWEAIDRLRPDWRVWVPSNAEDAVRQLGNVVGKTVIWLDETHRTLFRSPAGEQMADRLHDLLHSPRRGPLLVLVLLWTEQWNELTAEPRGHADDGHQRARALLTGHGIPIPPAFVSPNDRAALTAVATADPRLAQAVAEAVDGEVIQYLAGVPVLMERFLAADPGPKALVLAAMDIRRLGHDRDLPLALLEVAAYAYLTESQRHRLARQPNWLQHALNYLEADCRGTLGPLSPAHVGPNHPGPAQLSYRLADYLEQNGRRNRAAIRVPNGCWEALLVHAPRSELIGLARGAFKLYRYRVAIRLCSAAAEAGDNTAFGYVASWLARLDRWEEAVPWFEKAASVGDTAATCQVALVLAEHEHWDEANFWFRYAVSSTDGDALKGATRRLKNLNLDVPPWLGMFNLAAPLGDRKILIDAAGRLCEIGIERERWLAWFELIAASGVSSALSEAAWRLADSGHIDDALLWFRRAADAGHSAALGMAADSLAYAKRWDEAKVWYEEAVTAGHSEVLGEAAWLLNQDGYLDDAMAWFSRAVAAGHSKFLENAAQCLAEADRLDEALEWYQLASDAGSEHALLFAADQLGDSGRWTEANIWYERAASRDENEAANHALRHMVETSREEALLWYERAKSTGGTKNLRYTARELAKEGRIEEALTWFDRAAAAGEPHALSDAAEQLDKAERHEAALEWRKRAAKQGDPRIFSWIADQLAEGGLVKESLAFYDFAVKAGDNFALTRAIISLRHSNLEKELLSWMERAATAGKKEVLRSITWNTRPADQAKARQLFSYGWEPDGTIAEAWNAPLPPSE